MTWKVRGRSSSQTPEPVSTPMPMARMSSITRSSVRRCARRRRAARRRADRLVREGDQDQHRGADDEAEHAEIEEERAGQRHLADQRQLDILRSTRSGTDSRTARTPAPVERGEQQADADPATGRMRSRSSTQRVPPAMYCRMKADRHGDARHEAAARQVVAAQEEVDGQHDDDREQPVHDDRRAPAGSRPIVSPDLAVRLGLVEGVLDALLLGRLDAVRRRPEAAQQREDGQRDDAEDGDLAQRVEAAEVDEDDVDDVGAAAFGIGVLEEEAARSCPAAAASSRHRRAPPCRPRRRRRCARSRQRRSAWRRRPLGSASVFEALGQPAQAEQDAGPWSRSRRAAASARDRARRTRRR